MNRSAVLAAVTALLLLATSASATTGSPALSLADCLKGAAGRNSTLAVARHDERIALERVTIAGSSYLPRVDLQGGYTSQLDPQAVRFGAITQETQEPNYAFASLDINQTIYDFGRTRERRRAATLQSEASHAVYQGVEQDLFLQVVQAYYGILEQQQLLLSAEDEIRQREDHLRVARVLYEQGVVTRNDVLQAEVKLAASRQQRLIVSSTITNSWLTLNHLTGQPADFRAELAESLDPLPTDLQQETVTNRAELIAQQKLVEAGNATVLESRSSYAPELFLNLSLDYLENNKAREQAIMSATVGLRMNLFDGFATSARYRQSVKQLDQEKDRLRRIEETIRLELATARNDLTVATERIEVARQTIVQSDENLRINKDRYQAQVGTATEVIDAQTLSSQTRTDLYRAIFDRQVASARVKRALGQL